MDTATITSIAIGSASMAGLSVHAFTPLMFIALIVVIAVGVVVWKFGPKLFIQKRTTSCGTCMRIISTLNDTYRSRINIAKDEVLRQQMNFAELVFSSIELKIISKYKKSLDTLFIPPVKQQEEMEIYKALLANETHDLKNFVRLRLKENHILRYTRTQFSTYSNDICEKIIGQTRLDMTTKWVSNFSVPIAMNKKEIDELLPSIVNDVKSIFSTAYDIAEKKDSEVKELEKMFDDELKKVVSDARKGLI